MIDLILWAATKADMRTFAINRGMLIEVDDGEGGTVWTERSGLAWSWWAGSGNFLTEKRTERSTTTLDQTNATEVGINVGGSPPSWVEAPLELVRDGETIADFDRIQGAFAVFTLRSGYTASVGEEVTAWEPAEFLSGVVALMRIHGEFFTQDVRIPLETDPDKLEQWARSKLARTVRNADTSGTVADGSITYWEFDGVRLFRYMDVEPWLEARGLPGHMFLGGNRP